MGQRIHWVELTRTVGKLLSFFYFILNDIQKGPTKFRIVYVHVTLMLLLDVVYKMNALFLI